MLPKARVYGLYILPTELVLLKFVVDSLIDFLDGSLFSEVFFF